MLGERLLGVAIHDIMEKHARRTVYRALAAYVRHAHHLSSPDEAGVADVRVGTANFIDPESCIRIVRELEEYCRTNGIPRIQDIIGSLDLKGET